MEDGPLVARVAEKEAIVFSRNALIKAVGLANFEKLREFVPPTKSVRLNVELRR